MTSLIHFWNLQAIQKPKHEKKSPMTHQLLKKRGIYYYYTIYKPITWYIILLQTNINYFRDKFLASNYNRFKIPYLKKCINFNFDVFSYTLCLSLQKKIFAHPDYYRYIQEKYFFPKCSNIDVLNLKYIRISSKKNRLWFGTKGEVFKKNSLNYTFSILETCDWSTLLSSQYRQNIIWRFFFENTWSWVPPIIVFAL